MNTRNNNDFVNELNDFLKGLYMGIDSFDSYIKKAENLDVKHAFLNIQDDYKTQAQWFSNKIQSIGGTPSYSVGIIGKASELFNEFKNEITIHSTQDLLEEVYNACNLGYTMTEKHFNECNSLDKDTINKINSMLIDYKNHLDIIKSLSTGNY
ncbi:DUF2383 domain-containing protein [Clostridium senegalense]|uniref:DUF2383 domain-containing protein n=1 Tax=Clostridium senegalense TaxID=1465809 RepID=UPI001C0FBD86|nr:DUF2383 domain-containing protein [Clostridium senegalense]MBU5227716.1 PA2169 family four-helix-bundle protein [Clostridium senegalense]